MKITDLVKGKSGILERPPAEFTKGKIVFFLKGVTIDSNPAFKPLAFETERNTVVGEYYLK